MGWWTSPTTREGESSAGVVGQGGRLPIGGAVSTWSQRASHICQIERASRPARITARPGVTMMDGCEDGVHEGIGGVNQVKQGDFSRGGPGIEPHPQAHGRQGQVDENDLAPGLHFGLPARDHCGESDPLRGGLSGGPKGGPLNLLRWRISAKKGGSLSPPAPLSCGAPLRRAGGGPARRSLASLVASDAGNPCRPASVRRFGKIPNHTGEGSAL